jgi:hypothetical protein
VAQPTEKRRSYPCYPLFRTLAGERREEGDRGVGLGQRETEESAGVPEVQVDDHPLARGGVCSMRCDQILPKIYTDLLLPSLQMLANKRG